MIPFFCIFQVLVLARIPNGGSFRRNFRHAALGLHDSRSSRGNRVAARLAMLETHSWMGEHFAKTANGKRRAAARLNTAGDEGAGKSRSIYRWEAFPPKTPSAMPQSRHGRSHSHSSREKFLGVALSAMEFSCAIARPQEMLKI